VIFGKGNKVAEEPDLMESMVNIKKYDLEAV